MSPSEINRSGWPGAQVVGPITKYNFPVRRGDKFVFKNKERNIEAADPLDMIDVLVRIELQCRG